MPLLHTKGIVLLGAVSVLSFWLTVMLAVAGSALSVFCVAYPVSEPKRDPCSFTGQWFIWLGTPLLWGTVAASLVFVWLKPLDLVAALFSAALSGWCAQKICNLKWRGSRTGTLSSISFLAPPQRY
jgi:hypothetical protein